MASSRPKRTQLMQIHGRSATRPTYYLTSFPCGRSSNTSSQPHPLHTNTPVYTASLIVRPHPRSLGMINGHPQPPATPTHLTEVKGHIDSRTRTQCQEHAH
jgi:hypothetical protein